MFIVEGRTLGVFAALGVVLSMVVAFERLSDVADARARSLSATASAGQLQAMRHDDESALSNRSVATTRPSETVALGENIDSHPLNHLRN